MIWFALLLIGAVISGNDAYMQPLEARYLKRDVLAKGMVLQTFSLFLQRMYIKETNEKNEQIVKDINKKELAKGDDEVIAAIYDRYMGLRLTINYLTCLAFYKAGAAAPEGGEAEGCDEYAKYIIWFNTQFKAEEFLVQLESKGDPTKEYNIGAVVEKLQILYERQAVMIEAFKQSGSKTDKPFYDLFQVLRQPPGGPVNEYLTEADARPLEKLGVQRGPVEDTYRSELLERIYIFYGPELLYLETYWNLFFEQAAVRPIVTHPSHMVREPLVEEDAQRSHFKVMEESLLDATIHDFQNAHEVQYAGLLFQGLEMRVRNIDQVLPPAEWKLASAQEDSQIDFVFNFTDPELAKGPPPAVPGEGGDGGEGAGSVGGLDPSQIAGMSIIEAGTSSGQSGGGAMES